VTDDLPKRWGKFRTVVALAIAGLYLVVPIRWAVGGDRHDPAATRLIGAVTVVAAALFLATLVLAPEMADGLRNSWTPRRTVATATVCVLLLVGVVSSIIETGAVWGDPLGRLFVQTSVFAFMLFVVLGWIPLALRRR
jgi:hypothetical protein